jgi:hypothetical protein
MKVSSTISASVKCSRQPGRARIGHRQIVARDALGVLERARSRAVNRSLCR